MNSMQSGKRKSLLKISAVQNASPKHGTTTGFRFIKSNTVLVNRIPRYIVDGRCFYWESKLYVCGCHLRLQTTTISNASSMHNAPFLPSATCQTITHCPQWLDDLSRSDCSAGKTRWRFGRRGRRWGESRSLQQTRRSKYQAPNRLSAYTQVPPPTTLLLNQCLYYNRGIFGIRSVRGSSRLAASPRPLFLDIHSRTLETHPSKLLHQMKRIRKGPRAFKTHPCRYYAKRPASLGISHSLCDLSKVSMILWDRLPERLSSNEFRSSFESRTVHKAFPHSFGLASQCASSSWEALKDRFYPPARPLHLSALCNLNFENVLNSNHNSRAQSPCSCLTAYHPESSATCNFYLSGSLERHVSRPPCNAGWGTSHLPSNNLTRQVTWKTWHKDEGDGRGEVRLVSISSVKALFTTEQLVLKQ